VLGGVIAASTQGISNSEGNVQAGDLNTGDDDTIGASGAGSAYGNGEFTTISNAYLGGPLGAASAGSISGGNSTALAAISVADMAGNGASGSALGLIRSVGQGIGASGGYGSFGPSLPAAITAATPAVMEVAPTAVETDAGDNKNGKKDKNKVTAIVDTVEIPEVVFTFTPGLATGGGGLGFGQGSGSVNGTLTSDPANANAQIEKGTGGGFGTGFGFGAGSGFGSNAGGEQAGGMGGATALGGGTLAFEVDDIGIATFTNGGLTTSIGSSAAFVGFNPSLPDNFIQNLATIPVP
jgi:hypothetical protein